MDGPHGIFIDNDENVYIADFENSRVMEWKLNSTNGQIVVGENGQGNQLNQLDRPTHMIIDKVDNSLIIADWANRRVVRWPRQNKANAEILIEDIDCYGLTMDKDRSLYVSNWKKNEVRRWKIGEKNGMLVAGGNREGSRLNQLSWPTFIFVDEHYTLFVSDFLNHRVVKWLKDAKEGIVIAGGNSSGDSLNQLSRPQGIFVDQLGRLYVVDSDNHRVMLWHNGAKEGTILVGGNDEGNELNQLNYPYGLSFDGYGNLYVSDYLNNRIQKFEIDTTKIFEDGEKNALNHGTSFPSTYRHKIKIK